ncbi:MAG: hypothetical protein AAGF81_00675 [Pseudomonadota bacterium]
MMIYVMSFGVSYGCSGRIAVTAHDVFTCEEARIWLRHKLPELYAKEIKRIESGVEERTLKVVKELESFKRTTGEKVSDRLAKWAHDVAWDVSSGVLEYKFDKYVDDLKDKKLKKLSETDRRGAEFLLDSRETVSDLVSDLRSGESGAGVAMTKYAGETTISIIEAAGKAGPLIKKLSPWVTAGKIAIDVAASTGDAYLDIDAWREEKRVLDKTARRLIERSPSVRMHMLRETEATLRRMVEPTSPMTFGADLGGVLVAVDPVRSRALDTDKAKSVKTLKVIN